MFTLNVQLYRLVKMLWLVLTFLTLSISEVRSAQHLNLQKELSVAFSIKRPFVYHDQNGKLKGLDILIIENFAQENGLRVKFIEFNAMNLLKNQLQSVFQILS